MNAGPAYGKQQSAAFTDVLSGRSAYDLSPQTTEKYFQNAVAAPMLKNFDQNIAPRIKEQFAGMSAFSSRQGSVTQQALSDLQGNMGAQLSQAQFQNQTLAANLADNARQRQLQGLGALNQFQQQQAMTPIQQALGMSQLIGPFQQHADQLAGAQYQEWMNQRPENRPWLQLAMQYLGNNSQQLYVRKNPYVSAGAGALSGAVTGAPAGIPGMLVGGAIGAGAGYLST